MTLTPNLDAHVGFAHLMTFNSLMQTFLPVCLHRHFNISVVTVEIKQHLSEFIKTEKHADFWNLDWGGEKFNICSELKLFLKQAQKILIYLKYLKSLA